MFEKEAECLVRPQFDLGDSGARRAVAVGDQHAPAGELLRYFDHSRAGEEVRQDEQAYTAKSTQVGEDLRVVEAYPATSPPAITGCVFLSRMSASVVGRPAGRRALPRRR